MRYFVRLFAIITLSAGLAQAQECNRPEIAVNEAKQGDMCMDDEAKNVLGTALKLCCSDPVTGFYRNGFCQTGAQDHGTHVVCARITDEFLQFSKARGNDLITPRPEWSFPGLKSGDKWCLCAMRWKEAYDQGVAPPVILEATQEKALEFLELDALTAHEFKPH